MLRNNIWSNLTDNWLSQNTITKMSTTAMTIVPENGDIDGLLMAIVLSSCIGTLLIISGGIAIVCCYKKKLICSSQNTEKQVDDNEGAYIVSVSNNIGAADKHHGTITAYDNFCNDEYGMSNLNSAWDAKPEPYTVNSTHVNLPTDFKNHDIVVDIKTETHQIQTEKGYPDAESTFSPMQGFVSSLLSRYEEENIHETRTPVNTSTYEDEFQYSEQMKERGTCIVKSDFNPNASKYKSTPGLLKTEKGDALVILQNDLGSGWTCVRNSNTSQTGFVPTTHLEILS